VAPPQMRSQTAKTTMATIASLLQMAPRAEKFTVRSEIRQTLYWECNQLQDSPMYYGRQLQGFDYLSAVAIGCFGVNCKIGA
jgi:hypothetical protein